MRVSDKELSRILQQDGYEATDGYYDDGNGRAIDIYCVGVESHLEAALRKAQEKWG